MSRRSSILVCVGLAAIAATITEPVAFSDAAPRHGHFVCKVTDNGMAAWGQYVLLSGQQEVKTGDCRGAIQIPEGSYEARVTLRSALDRPVRRGALSLKGGERRELSFAFETGELSVEIWTGNRRSAGAVELTRNRKRVARLDASVPARLSTGTYGVKIQAQGLVRRFDAVTIHAREVRAISVDVATPPVRASP